MKQYTLNGHELLVVDKPEGATDFKVSLNDLLYCELFNKEPHSAARLPPGTWKILSTEEDWKDVVDREGYIFYDYELFRGHLQNYVDTALESSHSWLRSLGYEPGKVIVLMKTN